MKPLGVISSKFPQQKQVALLSATITSVMDDIKLLPVKDPFVFVLGGKYNHSFARDLLNRFNPVDTCIQKYIFVPLLVKEVYLVYLLRKYPNSQSIVFCATCR